MPSESQVSSNRRVEELQRLNGTETRSRLQWETSRVISLRPPSEAIKCYEKRFALYGRAASNYTMLCRCHPFYFSQIAAYGTGGNNGPTGTELCVTVYTACG